MLWLWSRQVPSARHLCLAICAPGLEELAAGELAALGIRLRRTFRGGVEFSASDRQLYAANLWARTITRIVVRVAMFRATTFDELATGAGQVAWERWLPPGLAPTIRVSATASRLFHTTAIAERLTEVAAPGADPSGPLLVVRLMHDRVTLSVDSSGLPLYQRGWRLETAKAPLRETLAAALLLASGWDRRSPLIDPFCGSGTVAVEAALLAAGRAPGGGRRFAFQDWPTFMPGTWASVAGEAEQRVSSDPPPPIFALDRDAGAVRTTSANAARAGVDDRVQVVEASISDLESRPPPGWVVTNPPYGKRVGGQDVGALYSAFGAVLRRALPGWTVGLFLADRRMAARCGLPFRDQLHTVNGGIPVSVVTAIVPKATNTKPRSGRAS